MSTSDVSALIALARVEDPKRMVPIREFESWLESPRAKQLASFVYEKRAPEGQDMAAEYQAILALSGVPLSAAP